MASPLYRYVIDPARHRNTLPAMNKPLTITELSRMGGKARWKTSTSKQRSEAMKKVRAARTAKQKTGR